MQTTTTSVTNLMGLLSVKRGAQMVTFTALTSARARKTGNPYGEISKRARVNGVVNFHYGNSVNRQRDREGNVEEFTPSPRKWGTRLAGLPFVSHKGNFYLEVKIERVLETEYFSESGTPLAEETIAAFLPEKRDQRDHQGVEKQIILADYSIGNIEQITFGGETYTIEPMTPIEAQQLAIA